MTGGPNDDIPPGFRITDVRVYRPYPDEVPWDLLDDRAAVDPSADEVQIRIAKLGEDVVGVYVAEPMDPLTFR